MFKVISINYDMMREYLDKHEPELLERIHNTLIMSSTDFRVYEALEYHLNKYPDYSIQWVDEYRVFLKKETPRKVPCKIRQRVWIERRVGGMVWIYPRSNSISK